MTTVESESNSTFDKAIQEATNALIKSHVTLTQCQTLDTKEQQEQKLKKFIKESEVRIPQHFLVMMAVIAWDFLNVTSVSQSNILKVPRSLIQYFHRAQ